MLASRERERERERENKDEWVFNGVKEAGASGMLRLAFETHHDLLIDP